MPANKCPNPSCDYFNRALPVNAKVCPLCSTVLGNVVPSEPNNSPGWEPQQQAPPPQQQIPPPQQQAPPPQQQIPPPQQQIPPPQQQIPAAAGDYVTNHQHLPYIPPEPPQQQPLVTHLPVLRLIHSSGREFSFCTESGFIGRCTPSVPIAPEIDLSGIPHEGIVSRRHARISWDWQQSTYTIVDISKNGIYLNGNPLNAGVPYRLLNGNSLQLGQENLVIFKIAIE
ncbi:MAG: FHA domain-containing protein [Cyanobacteria bacterium P01_D01_bin.116]